MTIKGSNLATALIYVSVGMKAVDTESEQSNLVRARAHWLFEFKWSSRGVADHFLRKLCTRIVEARGEENKG